MQMIQPNRDNFEFDGTIQYVMNASELSNQALAKLLYEKKTPDNHHLLHKRMAERSSRSRNVDASLGKGNAAGQSTSSFFNTKKNLTSPTLAAAA